MIRLPGERGKDLCDNHLGMTRRDILRVGGSGMLGLSLGGMLEMAAQAKESKVEAAAPAGVRPRASSCSICRAARAISTSGTPSPTLLIMFGAFLSQSQQKFPV